VTEPDEILPEIRKALTEGRARLEVVRIFFNPQFQWGVQVYAKDSTPGRTRWKKLGPLILPNEGETVADVLRMLGEMVLHGQE